MESLERIVPKGIGPTNVNESERLVSALGGGALALVGLRRGGPAGLGLALLGGALLYRGVSGHCAVYQALGVSTAEQQGGQSGIKVSKAITIDRSPEELFQFWRNFENLPRFMKHLESVKMLGDNHSHWVAKGPAGTSAEWDAEIVEEHENELIRWRSLPDSQVANAGEVRFTPGTAGRGTEVHVTLTYNPPAGVLGAIAAKLGGEDPDQQIEGDLRRFKRIIETGEIPTTSGQSSGRHSQVEKERAVGTGDSQPHKSDQLGPRSIVTKTLEDTFPASDPPSYTEGDTQGEITSDEQIGLGRKIY